MISDSGSNIPTGESEAAFEKAAKPERALSDAKSYLAFPSDLSE